MIINSIIPFRFLSSLSVACLFLFLQIDPPRYDNLLEVDKLAAVMNKVDSVKLVLQENVQVALANCVTLENIEKAAGRYVCMYVSMYVCVSV